MNKKRVMITGASGYIGAMLVSVFANREDIDIVFAIDKDEEVEMIKNHKNKDKIVFFKGNLANSNWQIMAETLRPEIIIHTAWQIREIYGQRNISWIYNIIGSDKVFDFVFSNNFVKRLIHFSTVASYGAFYDNKLDYRYKETDILRKTEYLYAEEKRICEEHLSEKYNNSKTINENDNKPMVMVLRPASVTGPRLRYDINKFSLQSALSGSLKKQKGLLSKIIVAMTSFMPATSDWMRQYIHEDDVVDIVLLLSLDDKIKDQYEIYNICPPGRVVRPQDMAEALNKKFININPKIIRLVFGLFWHATRGRVPTAPGVWSGYSYPIGVDGSKITKKYNYNYTYESIEALKEEKGRFAKNLN